MSNWLDSWTSTRYLNQQELAKRWARRGTPEADERPLPAKAPTVLPLEHSKYILKHGKKAYRRWVDMGCPDKEPPLVCPVMTMVAQFFCEKRHGVWTPYERS